MNVSELVFKEPGRAMPRGVWACGACGFLYYEKIHYQHLDERGPKEAAERCCNKACDDCGEPAKQHYVVCQKCLVARETKKEADRFEKAKKVPLAEYDGEYVYIEGFGDEGYVPTEDVESALEESPGTAPAYGWACDREEATFDLTEAISTDLNDNHYEDAFENVGSLDEAQKLVDKALEGVRSYHSNHSVAVLLPKPEIDEEDDIDLTSAESLGPA